ncbi:MAG: BtrH N-terminal domain-containing protein [Caldilineaceae bacterium]
MTTTPLSAFVPHTTHHCITGSMRNVYAFHGHDVSEELLLGLGAGLGFIYWQMKGAPPFLGGRANVGRPGEAGLEITAAQRTGVVAQRHETSSRRTAERALLDELAAGRPVMIYVDMGFLPYLGLPGDYHFGGHSIVVAGLDAAGNALVADRDGLLHPLPLATLAQARGSTHKPFPPQNAWYTFDFSSARPPTAAEVRQALRETVTTMLEPPIANLGVKGIRTAATRIPKWPAEMAPETLAYTCFNTFVFIDAMGGTGGGIFRYLYARFLVEAAALLDDDRLLAVGDELRVVGDQWQEVAQMLRAASAASDPSAHLKPASALMLQIADCEARAWMRLRDLME